MSEPNQEDQSHATSAGEERVRVAPPAGDDEAAEIRALEEAEALRQQLSQANDQLKEHKDKMLRALAEAENIRRRSEEEISKSRKFALEGFAVEILPVMDSLEKTLTTENAQAQQLLEGAAITLKQLQSAFVRNGLVTEDPLGQPFDPNRHQAIGSQESPGLPNIVLNVLQKGYLLHGRVVRPALVMVSKASASQEAAKVD